MYGGREREGALRGLGLRVQGGILGRLNIIGVTSLSLTLWLRKPRFK